MHPIGETGVHPWNETGEIGDSWWEIGDAILISRRRPRRNSEAFAR